MMHKLKQHWLYTAWNNLLRSKADLTVSVLQATNETEAPAGDLLDPEDSSNNFGPLGKIVIRNTLDWTD